MTTARAQWMAGVRAEFPIVLGVWPFGVIFGVLAAESGMSPWLAWSTSWIVFAGSAQFLALPLIKAGAPAVTLVFTTLVINLRHALYSASLAPYAQHLPQRWRVLLSYLLTDEAYAPTILHYLKDTDKHRHWFWLGAGLMLWINWQLSSALGLVVGALLPEHIGLEFTLALTFIGIVVPTLKNWPTTAAALSAGITAVATYALPYRLNLMFAALVGVGIGLAMEHRRGTAINQRRRMA
jgi:4-azaleucine resistance transporter AzlC